jgi:acetyltransferase EpsM
MKQLVVLGGGQHAVVVAEIAEENGYSVVGFLDDNIQEGTLVADYKILGKLSLCENMQDVDFVIGIGNNKSRKEIAERYKSIKLTTLVHPSAVISRRSKIDLGTVVCAHATVNTLSSIGKHCIINTAAIVEHGCTIEDYCHIASATLVEAYKTVRELTTGEEKCIKNV